MTRAKGYRPDIDGLRTVAVLSVCFSHSGLFGFSGGFVGVDVFFVISGFLITGILLREAEAGTYSIVRFYERRARRILPALLTLLTVLTVLGYLVFPPWQYESFAKSSVATLLFLSNFWFLDVTGGYFGATAEFEPLLHTWSLAVEEQFYIFFPLLIWALARGGRRRILAVVAGISLVSFALSLWMTGAHPFQNFYLLPTRAWELGVGALLTLGMVPGIRRRPLAELVALGGLLLILVSCFLLDGSSAFPGMNAVPAVLGAAAIIWTGANHRTVVNQLLSTKPFVGIGLISYSLYLWHWPPLVVARTFTGDAHLPVLVAVGCLLFALLAAYLSWRFVERPWRVSAARGGFGASAVFGSSAVAMVALAFCAGIIAVKDGFRTRLPDGTFAAYAEASKMSPIERMCRRSAPPELCAIGDPPQVAESANVLVWGDSHAAVLTPGFDLWLRQQHESGYTATKSACPPLLGVVRGDLPRNHGCAEFNREILAFVTQHPEIDTVVLVSRWALAAEGTRATGEFGGDAVLRVEGEEEEQDNFGVFQGGLQRTVDRLVELGRHVVIVEGVPEIGLNVPQTYLNRAFFRIESPLGVSRGAYDARNERVEKVLDRLAESPSVAIASVADTMCNPDCPDRLGEVLLYRDGNHLSIDGAEWLVPQVMAGVSPSS